MSRLAPIARAYESLLCKGRLQRNLAQEALVHQLGSLQQELEQRSSFLKSKAHSSHQNGIYIYGGVGTGKSRIADLFASTLPRTVTSKRIHFHEFMVDVHMRLHHARSQADYRGDPLVEVGRQICAESAVLCFDEFQVSDIADAMILKRLLGSFWNFGGMMVSTSNRHPTELYLNGLNRPLFIPFINELQQRCLVWKMEGEHDYRLDTNPQGRVDVFFTDRDEFDVSLQNATGHRSLEEVEVKVVMNRSIKVKASWKALEIGNPDDISKAVIYATFESLCEKSRGTSDYHALCRMAHTIYVDNVRQFAADELDFVRRFITLIDIAYETRTRIICFSATPFSELFRKIGISAQSLISSTATDGTNEAPRKESLDKLNQDLTVRKEGGSSSSMMSTFIGEVEWSATGLAKASLATGGAGETDVRFAIARAISRLSEMGSIAYSSTHGEA